MATAQEGFSPKFLFSTKWERLDWKRIASLDIEKIMVTGNTEVLEDLIYQVAHCRPESEFNFDSDTALDSGFLKVFRISQLIIEYLCFSLERLKEKYKQVMDDLTQTQKGSKSKTCEIQNLKDTLTQAKKELRRRKELLASVQNEVIGDNKDEFDPCPYCSKKFMNSSYLLSHMHRRHQGLPINPVFPSQSMYQIAGYTTTRGNEIQAMIKSPGAFQSVASFTQTDHELCVSQVTQNTVIDYAVVHDLVEKCLLEKKLAATVALKEAVDEKYVLCKEDREIQTSLEEKEEKKECGLQSETDMTVASLMTEIKSQLDLQWKYISTKLEQAAPIVAEPGELQVSILLKEDGGENGGEKLQTEVAISSLETSPLKTAKGAGQRLELLEISTDAVEMELCGPASPLQIRVNEQLQKQQADLQTLKTDLQAKMDSEINIIEGKLEAQERFWRSRLKQVKEEYDNEVSEMKTDFQKHLTQLQDTLACQRAVVAYNENPNATSNPMYGSIQNLLLSQNPKKQEQEPPEVSPIKAVATKAVEVADKIYHSTPRGQTASTSFYKQSNSEEIQKDVSEAEGSVDHQPSPIYERKGSLTTSFRPSPRRDTPRSTATPKAPVPKPRTTPDPVIFIQSRSKDEEESVVPCAATHEYSEPASIEHEAPYSESCSECDSESLDMNEGKMEKRSPEIAPGVKLSSRRPSLDEGVAKSATLRRNSSVLHETKETDEYKTVEEDRAKIEPIISELQFRARGTKFQESIRSEGGVQRQQSDQLPNDPQGPSTSHDLMGSIPTSLNLVPKADQSRSPFTKIFAAVKSSGRKVHKTMKHAIGTKKNKRKSPTLAVPKAKSKQSKKPGFFSKARWSKKGKNGLKAKRTDEEDSSKSQNASSAEASDASPRSSVLEIEREYIPRHSPGHQDQQEENESDSSSGGSSSKTCSNSEIHQLGTPHHRKNSKINRDIQPNAPKAAKYGKQITKGTEERHEWPSRNPFLVPDSRNDPGSASPCDKRKPRNEGRRSNARRSLLQEFQECSPPRKTGPPLATTKPQEEPSDETELDSSLWDEESIEVEQVAAVKVPKLVAEYSEIKPNRFKPVQQVALVDSDEDMDTVKGQRGVSSPKDKNGNKGGNVIAASTTLSRPVTARLRVVVDSWDTEDSSRGEPVRKARNTRDSQFAVLKPGLYTKSNVMSTKPRVQEARKNCRDSPLNNSWDSN